MLPTSRREDVRVAAFVAAIRATADADTVELPPIVATASTREPDEPPHVLDRLGYATAALLLALILVPLLIATAKLMPAPVEHRGGDVMLTTVDTTPEPTAHGGIR